MLFRSAYAAWRYLTPNEAVREMGEPRLADAFSEENAVYLNETQSYGGYDVTLLGITGGKNLTSYRYLEENTAILEDRSYILIAVESEEADPASYMDLELVPIITGYDADLCQSIALAAGDSVHSVIKDNVLYYLYECSDLEKFADHAVYVCVSDDTPGFSKYTYLYDSAAGTIARNEQYEGLNALFAVPLDSSKADPNAAAAQVKACEDRRNALEQTPGSMEGFSESLQEAFRFVEQITPENISDYATPLTGENAELTFVPDSQGRVDIRYSDGTGESRMKIEPKDLFADGKTEAVSYSGASDGNPDSILVEYYTLNEDGSVTLRLYTPNLPK